jgi:hypothetical protein
MTNEALTALNELADRACGPYAASRRAPRVSARIPSGRDAV